MHAEIQGFFDPNTSTVSYVVHEANGLECAIIDPVLDYNAAAGRVSTDSADRIIRFVDVHGLKVQWLLETHAHADHLSASAYLKQKLGGQIGIGSAITQVQGVFRDIYHLEPEFKLDGSQFDRLFEPDEIFHIGRLRVQALHVPGHTPADMAYQIEHDNLFVGDTLFMPDVGTARCDFPGAMHSSCINPSSACSPCRTRLDCSCATITHQTGAKPCGRAPWVNNAREISTLTTTLHWQTLSTCAPPATPRLESRHC